MEEYKTIQGYENYEISNLGNVRNKTTNKILKPHITTTGYYEIKLIKKHFKIHKLLGLYFLENPNNLKCIDHIDRCKTNNNLDNLRWCSYSDNSKNKTKNNNCSSIYMGVSKYIKGGYECYVWDNYKKNRIGVFKTELEAYEKRKKYIESINNNFYNL